MLDDLARLESRIRIGIAVHDETTETRNFRTHLLQQGFCIDILS
jgi:hypothetical protein